MIHRMIEKEEVKRLAELSHLELSEREIEDMRGEIESILEYVSEIQGVTEKPDTRQTHTLAHNVLRDDNAPHPRGMHTEKILAEAPHTKKNYIRVKKIL